MNGKIRCTSCGNMIPIGTPYCVFCGTKQNATNTPQNNVKRRRKKQQTSGVPIIRAGEDVMVPVNVKEAKPQAPVTATAAPVETAPAVQVQPDNKTSGMSGPSVPVTEKLAEPQTPTATAIHSEVKAVEPVTQESTVPPVQAVSETVQKENAEGISDEQLQKALEKISRTSVDTEKNKEPESDQKTEDSTSKGKNKWKEKKEKKAAEYENSHDSLTDLFNLGAYEERLKKAVPENLCIIVSDVNNLTKVNEMYGHDNGDLLLSSVAKAMQEVFGNNCYRIGEDEFAVVLERVNEKSIASRMDSFQDALRQSERKLREEGKQLDLKVAVGYAYGSSTVTAHDVENEAKTKMNSTKKQMKQIYNPNYDGYYDDVKAEYEEAKVQIDRDNMHKVFVLLIGFAIFMAAYFIFFI